MRRRWAVGVLWGLLPIAFVLALGAGRYVLTPSELLQALFGSLRGETAGLLLLYSRIPRILCALLSGAMLGLSGAGFQTLFGNPLASPDVLGVGNGASFGAAAALLFGASGVAVGGLAAAAGIASLGLVLLISAGAGGDRRLTLLLGGIAVGAVASSGVMLIKYLADSQTVLPKIEFWLMGSLSNSDWEDVRMLLFFGVVPGGILLLNAFSLKVMTLGEGEAAALGVRTRLVRTLTAVCCTLLAAGVIAVAGMVSWIGLMAPHLVRLLLGDEAEHNLFHVLPAGALLLLAADTLARTLHTGEVPLSVLTALFGAVLLLILLVKRGKDHA